VHCETLYHDNDTETYETEPGPREPAPTLHEVEKALESVRSGKAAGPDGLPTELLKLGGDSVVKAMHKIITSIWNTGKWTEHWTQSTFVPLHKKGDPTVCANYGTISLILHARKVLLKVILGRIQRTTELEVAKEEAGFRPQRGMHNHLCSLRILTEKAESRQQPLYMCIIDFEKAFRQSESQEIMESAGRHGFCKTHRRSNMITVRKPTRSSARLLK